MLPPVVGSFFDWKVWRQVNRLEVALDDTLLHRVGASCNEEAAAPTSTADFAGHGGSCEVNDVAKHRAAASPPR